MGDFVTQIQELRKAQAEEFNKAYEELVKQFQCRIVGQIVVIEGKLEIQYFVAPLG